MWEGLRKVIGLEQHLHSTEIFHFWNAALDLLNSRHRLQPIRLSCEQILDGIELPIIRLQIIQHCLAILLDHRADLLDFHHPHILGAEHGLHGGKLLGHRFVFDWRGRRWMADISGKHVLHGVELLHQVQGFVIGWRELGLGRRHFHFHRVI